MLAEIRAEFANSAGATSAKLLKVVEAEAAEKRALGARKENLEFSQIAVNAAFNSEVSTFQRAEILYLELSRNFDDRTLDILGYKARLRPLLDAGGAKANDSDKEKLFELRASVSKLFDYEMEGLNRRALGIEKSYGADAEKLKRVLRLENEERDLVREIAGREKEIRVLETRLSQINLNRDLPWVEVRMINRPEVGVLVAPSFFGNLYEGGRLGLIIGVCLSVLVALFYLIR